MTDRYPAVSAAGGDPSGWIVPNWSPEEDATFRTKHGITTSILSLTSPGAPILKDPEEAAKLSRRANEYCAKIRDADPGSYGFLAALPSLMDKSLALQEIAYALDVLKADGVTVFTRYGPGHHYLGHPDFVEIWDELDKRQAVVFVHPTHPVDTTPFSPKLPQSVIEYPFETTKTAVDLILSHCLRDHPNCKIILSHSGGTLPYLANRPGGGLTYISKGLTPAEFVEDARKFYFDTAVSGGEYTLMVLEKFAKPSHILYGSDFPYAHSPSIDFHTAGLDRFPFKNREMLQEINHKNALALFPRLAALRK